MTAPAGIADISTSMAAVQARMNQIASLMGVRNTASAPRATTTTSASDFANALAGVTGTAANTSAASTTLATGATSGDAVVADAKRYLGIPYVWGGESTTGMDCSGLVQKTFGDLGVTLPRTAAEQQTQGTAVPSLAQAQPGDLLFFGNPAYHVAIYAGDNKLIESPEPGKTVHVTDVYQTPTSIRRIGAAEPATSYAAVSSPATTYPTGATSTGALTAAGISPKVAAYAPQFAAAETQFHLPTGLLAAVAQQESGGNPSAVSPAGAQGLMQLMPATAAGLGVDPLDPGQAIQAAARILSRNLGHFNGSVPLALAGYNAGVGAVDQYNGIPPYTETQNYVKSITAMMAAGG